MSDVLCIYYSRSGKTKQAMEEISAELGAELVQITDTTERGGWRGYLRCGLDAMCKKTASLSHFETEKPLEDYKLVMIGTPVWAGRCSSVIRTFLNDYGAKLKNAAFVVTRDSESKFQEVYQQMDHYLDPPHMLAVSLRCDSVGYYFWQEEFLKQTKAFLEAEHS